MKSVALSGNVRAERGSANAGNLRKKELIPCVIYGGKENIHFTINEVRFGKIINTPEVYFIDLDIDGAKYKAIIKALQFHPVTDKVLHADFLEVFEDKDVVVRIPVKLTGRSIGIANGGTLRTAKNRLKIKGLPSAIPENIEIDITNLRIGDSIKVGELNFEGLTFLGADNSVVVAVKRSRAELIEVSTGEESEEEEGLEGGGTDTPTSESGEETKKTEAAPTK